MIINGSVINTAIDVEEIIVNEITIGIGLMNSPMIPVANNNGTNDQIVVNVVDHIGMMQSRHTSRPVSSVVNFPARKYVVIADTTTMVSSINSPSESRKAKSDKKLIDIPKNGISMNADKKVSGTVIDEIIA